MIILATMHDEKFAELAAETWDNNKVKYAIKHGYAYVAKTEDFYGFPPGFEKVQFLIDLLDEYPDTEWIWWTGTDSMVTNFNIRVEDKVIAAADVVMSADFNFIINCDSILVRNTAASKAWLQSIMDAMPKYHNHQFKEQQFMIDSIDETEAIISLQPQHYMNSYEYKCYTVSPWNYKLTTDVNGDRGQWEPGDWLVHWPGTQPNERIQLVAETKDKIIY